MIYSCRTLLGVVLILSLPACSTQTPKRIGTTHTQGVGEHAATPLFVHFGIGFGDATRLLSVRARFGEPFEVAGGEFWHLTGRIDRRGDEIVAELMGSTGVQGGPYKGVVRLEEPLGSQGGISSGGATHMWFGVSTNFDPASLIDQINAQYQRAIENATKGEPDGAANRSQPTRAETTQTSVAAGSDR
ncbi:MAG: hypothetical protein HS113_22655 [Verrucomicrobiales bacterium]|nr:hypothetical protein [Verrucomicrobiales bacterium]